MQVVAVTGALDTKRVPLIFFSQVADLTAAHSQLENFANDRGDEITMLEGKLHIASEEKKSLMEQLQLTKNELANANA